jgi:hypothetical protein
MTNETKKMMFTHYARENFPVLVAHSYGWDIYAKAEMNEDGEFYCAAIPNDTKSGRMSHSFGDTSYVARMIREGYLRPVHGNLHLATA